MTKAELEQENSVLTDRVQALLEKVSFLENEKTQILNKQGISIDMLKTLFGLD